MNKKAACIMLLTLLSDLSASTSLASGTMSLNETWNADTVLVIGHVTVNNGVILTIDPGTFVLFQDTFALNIQGQLLAQGTESDSIIFSAQDTGIGWRGIRFDSTSADNDSSLLSYCRIEYGKANYGGGIFLRCFSKVRVSNCLIVHNIALWYGAGIFCSSASPVLTDNTIDSNIVRPLTTSIWSAGGGIYCKTSSPLIARNIITNNEARNLQSFGGGIHVGNGSAPIIIGNVISKNSAGWQGGGLAIDTASPVLSNNVIAKNTSSYGAGLRISGSSSACLSNNTICNNASQTSYGGGLSLSSSSPVIINTIIWGNTGSNAKGMQVYVQNDASDPAFQYCDIEGGIADFGGNGSGTAFTGLYENNLNADPLFADSAADSFALVLNSPCINTGSPDTTGVGSGEFDIAGNPRVHNGQIDMGAYEYQGIIGISSPGNAPALTTATLRIGTNPSNTGAIAIITLPASAGPAAAVSLTITNIRGETIQRIFNGTMRSGSHILRWNGCNGAGSRVPSGIYFFRLRIKGSEELVKRFVLY